MGSKTEKAPAAKKAPARRSNGKAKTNGQFDPTAVFSAEGLAAELTKAADALALAVETGEFCAAMDHNLELWVAIKSMISLRADEIDAEARAVLTETADQVAYATFLGARNFAPESVLPLIGTNLEVARGLIDGVFRRAISDRAYFLWLESGGCHGNDQDFWFAAERDIQAELAP